MSIKTMPIKGLFKGISKYLSKGSGRKLISNVGRKFTFRNIGKGAFAGVSGAVIIDTLNGGNIISDMIKGFFAGFGHEVSNSTINLSMIGIAAAGILVLLWFLRRRVG